MALAFDNAQGTATTDLATSRQWLLTATTGACLLVYVNVGSGTGTVSAVAANGTPLTRLDFVEYRAAAARRMEVWGLTSCPSGTITISAVLVNAATNVVAGGVTYTGHKTDGSPFGGITKSSASATTQSVLIISATSDNLAVFGFGQDGGVGTVGAGLTRRFQTTGGGYPFITIADAPGALAVTGTGSASTAYWGNLGINLIASTGAATITGSMSATDAPDTFSAPAYVLVSGRVSATDALDTFAATGKVIVSGRVSATDAGSDTLSAPGYVLVSGRLSATDAQDTFAASGYSVVSGRLSATDAVDTFAATGQIIVSGRLSATDAPDTFLATGTVSSSAVVTPAPTPDPGAGWGKGKGKRQKPPYIQLSNDWWDARERYLQSLQPETTAEEKLAPLPEFSPETPAIAELEPFNPAQLVTYSVKRTELIAALPTATTMRQLRSYGDELRKINRLILRQKLMGQLIEQAARDARAAERQRRIARKRRILATLKHAHDLLSLYKSR